MYEEEYVRAKTGNAAEDKDEATRSQARLLLKGLFAKLDALSHFHFAPKPIIKEMTVQSEVPALAMEEVAPQVIRPQTLIPDSEVSECAVYDCDLWCCCYEISLGLWGTSEIDKTAFL